MSTLSQIAAELIRIERDNPLALQLKDRPVTDDRSPYRHGGDTEVSRGRMRKARRKTLHYPQGIKPVHYVRDWIKVRNLVQTAEQAGTERMPPILVDQGQLMTGTHRWVANELLERRGRTSERYRVMELEAYPLVVRFVIRALFNAEEIKQLQPAFHVMVGLPLRRHEREIKQLIDPAVWACCDSHGRVFEEVVMP